MNKIYCLCENDRGRFFFEILRKFYEECTPIEDGGVESFEREVYEIKCGNIILGYSEEPERTFCKNTMEFSTCEKKKVKFIKTCKKNNVIIPKHYEFFLDRVFPYFGIDKKFKNCIILIDNPLMLGEVNERAENCTIIVLGRSLNHRFLDYRIKMIFFYFSPFEDIEIDGYLIKKFERFKEKIENFEIKAKEKTQVRILESLVFSLIEFTKEKIKEFNFLEAGKILFEKIPEVLGEFNFEGYSFEEFSKCLEYYRSFIGDLFGCFEKKEIRLEFDERAIEAYRIITKTIGDIKFLKNKMKNKKKVYIRPPKEFFDYFEKMVGYIRIKTGLEVEIVEELPKRKRYKEVGILLE